MKLRNVTFSMFAVVAMASAADWKSHEVQFLNGPDVVGIPAQIQIVTESWIRVVAVPYIAYAPETDRVVMLVSCDYPHQAMTLSSTDRGATWSEPKYVHLGPDGKADTGMGIGLTHLGDGRMILMAGRRWFSNDCGESWTDSAEIPSLPDGKTWNSWDPLFVDRDREAKQVKRMIETGYSMDHARWESNGGPGYSKGHLRESTDGGRTWSDAIKVPEWDGVSEVTILRAANGYLVAACRTDKPQTVGETLDHYEGLAISISSDDAKTWSPLNRLYAWGRHHPSLVLMPDGAIVMTYVVRLGYTKTTDDLPRFAIEAIVSRDNGKTWDLDHRYVLHWWVGNRIGPNSWWASSQATSTVLLPDGALLTAFGTGYRSQPNENNLPAPRDVGLVQWRLTDISLQPDNSITLSPLESDTRNVFSPDRLRKP